MFESNHNKAFFLQRKENDDTVLYCTGQVVEYDSLDRLPIKKETDTDGKRVIDSISLIPFCQVKERGFETHDADEKIKCIKVETSQKIPLKEILDGIKRQDVSLRNITYNMSEQKYEEVVQKIIDHEIGQGEGANFVIPRRFDADMPGDNLENVLAIFRSLLVNEYGAYWTYVFSDGETYMVGASPERHISMEKKEVKMNPISGTFRKDAQKTSAEQQHDLQTFLDDKKETFELFMVTDEELKMMCAICEKGGYINGPFLKEMAHLIHTEYVLVGQSDYTIPELLRASMYAPTVTGSPIQNACRIIKKYETQSRGYYSATIALIGRDEKGDPFLDSPITIRS